LGPNNEVLIITRNRQDGHISHILNFGRGNGKVRGRGGKGRGRKEPEEREGEKEGWK